MLTEVTYKLTWPGKQITTEKINLRTRDGGEVSEADALAHLEAEHGKGSVKIIQRKQAQ